MSPIMFESMMLLKINRSHWDVKDVAAAIKEGAPSEMASRDSDDFYD